MKDQSHEGHADVDAYEEATAILNRKYMRQQVRVRW
jgi:hypothetical protein